MTAAVVVLTVLSVAMIVTGFVMQYVIEPLKKQVSTLESEKAHLMQRVEDLSDPASRQCNILNKEKVVAGKRFSYAHSNIGIKCKHCGHDAHVTPKAAVEALLDQTYANHGLKARLSAAEVKPNVIADTSVKQEVFKPKE